MANKIQARVQTKSIVIATAQPAAVRAFYVDLDAEFKRCKGFYVIRNLGNDYLKIAIRDQEGKEIQDSVNLKHLEVSTNPKIADRFFMETPIAAQGRKLTITLENFANTVGEQNIDLLFLLDNNEV